MNKFVIQSMKEIFIRDDKSYAVKCEISLVEHTGYLLIVRTPENTKYYITQYSLFEYSKPLPEVEGVLLLERNQALNVDFEYAVVFSYMEREIRELEAKGTEEFEVVVN